MIDALRIIAAIVAVCLVVLSLPHGRQGYDCSLAAFHPDYSAAVRAACRAR